MGGAGALIGAHGCPSALFPITDEKQNGTGRGLENLFLAYHKLSSQKLQDSHPMTQRYLRLK